MITSPISSSSTYPPERTIDEPCGAMPRIRPLCSFLSCSSCRSRKKVPGRTLGTSPSIVPSGESLSVTHCVLVPPVFGAMPQSGYLREGVYTPLSHRSLPTLSGRVPWDEVHPRPSLQNMRRHKRCRGHTGANSQKISHRSVSGYQVPRSVPAQDMPREFLLRAAPSNNPSCNKSFAARAH
jgi:hypothetical protein